MRTLIILLSITCFFSFAEAKDTARPKVSITKVIKSKKGTITKLDFFLKATDDVAVRWVEVRAAVDGKQGPWRRYQYFSYPGSSYNLPYLVDCNIFTFEVRSIDRSGKRSKLVRRTFSNLK